jgi:hypothetical protein
MQVRSSSVKRIGAWLAILAIALQAALPLIASAQSRSVTLVPLCTVDGVTHYVEVPLGKTPAGQPGSHGSHCALCFVGDKVGLPTQPELLALAEVAAEGWAPLGACILPKADYQSAAARAPPVSAVVNSISDNVGRQDEQASGVRRAGIGAAHGERFLRLGLLHDQH